MRLLLLYCIDKIKEIIIKWSGGDVCIMKLIGSFVGVTMTTAALVIAAPAAAQVVTLRIESILPAAHGPTEQNVE